MRAGCPACLVVHHANGVWARADAGLCIVDLCTRYGTVKLVPTMRHFDRHDNSCSDSALLIFPLLLWTVFGLLERTNIPFIFSFAESSFVFFFSSWGSFVTVICLISFQRDSCFLCGGRIFAHYREGGFDVWTADLMGHIIDVPVGNDLGPLLNHTSIALYVIAVIFVAIR